MIRVLITRDANRIKSIKTADHAYYDEYGQDIVCSAVSALVINTINSIIELVELDIPYIIDENENSIEIKNVFINESCDLLLASLELGLINIFKEYPNHIVINYEEV